MTLPSGWAQCEVADIAANDHDAITDGPFGSSLKSDHYTSSGIRVIRLGNIGSRRFISDDEAFVDESRFQELRRHEACAGDLVTAALGEPLGRTAKVPPTYGPAIVKADCFRLRPSERVENNLILYWLNSPTVLRSFLDRSQGIGRVRINLGTFRTTTIPIPPLAEQRRIVAKLDGLTARIARARAELDRASHLAKAVRTTAVESAFARKRCASNARELPVDGITIQDLVDEGPTNGWSPPSGADATGTLTLKLTATTSGRLRLDPAAVKRIYDTPPDTSKFWLQTGDLLIQRANALEHVGATAIYEGPSKTYIYPDLMMRIRVGDPKLTRLLWYYFNSPRVRAHFRDKATGTAGNMPKISGAMVKSLTFPKLSEVERELTLQRLDAAFARADRLEAEAARATALLDRLEASILAKAFRGELVPQDPADEPASALLDRIRTERASAPGARRGRRVVLATSN